MHKQGHFGLGLLSVAVIGLIVAELGYIQWVPFISLAGIAGGLLPDIDNKPIIPFKHHGWTHTVVFAVLSGFFISIPLAAASYSVYQILVASPLQITPPSSFEYVFLFIILYVSALIGALSHLFGDTLSTAGGTLLIRPWRPVSKNHVRFGVTTAGNPFYNLTFFAAGVVSHSAIYYVYLS